MNSEMLVREAMACYGLGDLAGFLSFLNPDVEWIVHSAAPLPFGGSYRGPQAVSGLFADTGKLLQVSGILWSNFLSLGEQTALYGMASHRCLTNGSQETAAFAHWYEVRDNLIVRVQQFFDTASIQRMLEGKPSLRPVAKNASSTVEAIGLLASISQQVDANESEDFSAILGLYGPEAPPRSITLPERADKNIEWSSSGMGSLPTAGLFYGVEAFGRHIAIARQLLGNYCLHIDGQISIGNTLALHGRMTLDPLIYNQQVSPYWFQALTVRDGKILRGVEVFDSQGLVSTLMPMPGSD